MILRTFRSAFNEYLADEISYIYCLDPLYYVIGGDYRAGLVMLYSVYRKVSRDENWLLIGDLEYIQSFLGKYSRKIIYEDGYRVFIIHKEGESWGTPSIIECEIIATDKPELFALDRFDGVLFINTKPFKTGGKVIAVSPDPEQCPKWMYKYTNWVDTFAVQFLK